MVPLVFSVDDDPTGQLILSAFLKDEEFCKGFVSFQCPERALTDLQSRAKNGFAEFPEVLIIDIRMPKMDGWDLVNHLIPLIEGQEKQPAIIMLTGTATSADHEKALANPFVQSLEEKPLTSKLLLKLRGAKGIRKYFSSEAQATCA